MRTPGNLNSLNNRTLVIGGGGYLGSHLVPALLRSGRHVTVLGRSSSSKHFHAVGADYCLGDFSDLKLLSTLLDEHQEVIHLAYGTVPNTSFSNPLSDLLQNLSPVVNLFTEVARRDRKLILVSSGGTVYGEASKVAISEDHATNPISPYGVTKLTLEKYAHLYAVTHGLRVICVRPGNAYGIGQRPYIGQGFIATAIASIMDRREINIFGENGTIRDYIHVSDISEGIVSTLNSGVLSETYNIGTGTGRSNIDVVKAVFSLIDGAESRTSIQYFPARKFDVQRNVLDSTKLNKDTGWAPKIKFQDGLLETINWMASKRSYDVSAGF